MSISIGQLIEHVRDELLVPPKASTPEAMYPFLFVEDIELEVAVTVSSTAEAGGSLTIQVVEVGAKANITDEETHRIKIKLAPLRSKEQTRKILEERLGPHGMERLEDTSLRGTAKDLS